MNSTNTATNGSTREGAGKAENLVSITPFFIVKDLQTSIGFYRERLGFQLDFQGPDGDVYYAWSRLALARERARLHLERSAET